MVVLRQELEMHEEANRRARSSVEQVNRQLDLQRAYNSTKEQKATAELRRCQGELTAA